MKKIFKYPLVIGGGATLQLPSGAKVLHVQMQHGSLHFWAEVHPDNEPEYRSFVVHGTGHEIPEDGRGYLGSCLTEDGNFVWHVYEVPNTPLDRVKEELGL